MATCPASNQPLFPAGVYRLIDVQGFAIWKQCTGCGRMVRPSHLNWKGGMKRYIIPRHNA
jgi:hypothetical protein